MARQVMTPEECKSKGGTWTNGICVFKGTIALRIFKGNPCQGHFITKIVKVSNPAKLRSLARVGLKSSKTGK